MTTSESGVRPVHFMVIFWGQRYREYFVDLCLPSLLAPHNLPLLRSADGHRFMMATTKDDWRTIERLPIMDRLRRHATPVWVEIGSPEETPKTAGALARYAATIRHQEVCYRALLAAAYHPRAYGSLLGPDVIVSDGLVAAMLKYARAGHHLVLRPALRQVEEDVLSELEACGLVDGERLSETARDLTIPTRLAADLVVRHLHPELLSLEEGAPGQPERPPFRYWRMPEGRGIVLRTFFALPVLMDFSLVPTNHAACLDRDAFENIYFSENFGKSPSIHAVQDSDEFSVLSLTPRSVNYAAPTPTVEPARSSWRQRYARLLNIRRSMKFYTRGGRDNVRRQLFHVSFRWHRDPLDEVWMREERRIDRLVEHAVGDYDVAGGDARVMRHPRYVLLDLIAAAPLGKLRALVGALLRKLHLGRLPASETT
jgi:hypothetical protein